MPKFPLFKDEPMHGGLIHRIRAVFRHPEEASNMALINDLLDVHHDPLKGMPWDLITLVSETCCFNNVLRNALYGCAGDQDLRRSGGRIAREINRWVLVHAEAAGFLPAPAPFPNQFDIRPGPASDIAAVTPNER